MNKICAQCGIEFPKPYTSSKKTWEKTKFCSRACALVTTGIKKGVPLPESWKAKMKGRVSHNKGKPGNYYGEQHWNFKGGRVFKNCIICLTEFSVIPKRRDSARFCSKKCAYAFADKGLTPLHKKIRQSSKYAVWRKSVYERDNYTCQECAARSVAGSRLIIQADHIKPFCVYPDLRFELSNGRTLCKSCHKKTDTYGKSIKWHKHQRTIEILRAF